MKHTGSQGAVKCLTSPCKLFWQAPLLARWPPDRLRCGVARSPSAAPQSSPQQTPDCPVEQEGWLSKEHRSLTALISPVKFQKADSFYLSVCVCLTGPTNPSRPVRLKGISPMGAPAWLTGITYRLAEKSHVELKHTAQYVSPWHYFQRS